MNLIRHKPEQGRELPDHLIFKLSHAPLSPAANRIQTLYDLFGALTFHLYSPLANKLSNLKNKNVVVTGRVVSDGIGDLHHQLNAAKQIKLDFPDMQVTIIPFFDLTVPEQIEKPPGVGLIPIESRISQTAIEKTKEADLVLEISQRVLNSEYLCIKKLNKHVFIGEYGFNGPSMGLGLTDLGIILKEKPSQTLTNLNNSTLKKILFSMPISGQQDIKNYIDNHELFFSYLKSGSYYQITFIYTAILYQQNSSKPTIDIITPQIPNGVLNHDFCKKNGISKIKFITNKNDVIIEEEHKLGAHGKELRLIHPFPLSQEDFIL